MAGVGAEGSPIGVGPIGVGLIGFGMAGRVFHAPLVQATEGLALVAVASSRGAEAARACPEATIHPDPESLLADPAVQLVILATPNATHAPLAEAALRAGKHVVIDKPFALNLDDARAIAALAERQGLLVQVFQNRRWDSDFLGLQDALGEGLLGDVVHAESRIERFRPEVKDRWREDGSPGSGLWIDIGPHLIDQALALFGRPTDVLADLAVLRRGGKTDDWAEVVLRYPGRRVVLGATVSAPRPGPRLVVHGTRGSLIKRAFDPQEDQLVAGLRPGDPDWGQDADPVLLWDGEGRQSQRPAPRGAQEQFYGRLAAALAGHGDPPNTVAAMLDVQAVVDASYRSAAKGRAVVPAWAGLDRVAPEPAT